MKGIKFMINPKMINIGIAIDRTADRYPEKEAIVYGQQRISYAQLDQRINRTANFLLSKGVQQNDHIAALFHNKPELLIVLYACAKIGVTCVPVNFRLKANEISYIVNNSKSGLFIYDYEFEEEVVKAKKSFNILDEKTIIRIDTTGNNGLTLDDIVIDSAGNSPRFEIPTETPWYIGYTSGTTGFPKGAVRSHFSNIMNALSLCMEYSINYNDILLLVMPLFHSNSIWFNLAAHYTGATVVLNPERSFQAANILKLIQDESITWTSMVPTMYYEIVNCPQKNEFNVDSIKTLLCSSAPVTADLKKEILSFFKKSRLYEGYGSTEAGGVTSLQPEEQEKKLKSIGKPVINALVKILNENGEEVKVKEVGEIYSYGPSLFEGYYEMPEKDKECFRGDWFSAGDMAYKDEEGFLFLVDRKQDMIISGGENVYPTEVEEVIKSNRKIREAAVIGIFDEKWGEAVKAIVALKAGEQMTEDELIKFCKERMAGYKSPKSVAFVDSELPKTPTGKILRKNIRDEYNTKELR
jgi:long-chain acyl-CoA synthetase